MIIALGGKGASGKTTVAKMLAEKLHMKHYSIGNLMRELAEKKRKTILELNKQAENDPSIDKWLDRKQEQLGKTQDNFVVDARLAFKFIPRAVQVLLDVKDKVAAERLMQIPPRKGEKPYKNKESALQALRARRQSEIKRLKKYYGVNPYDKRHFDIVIDTSRLTPEKTSIKVLAYLKKRKLL